MRTTIPVILLCLVCWIGRSAVPTLESFEPTQFDTNSLRVKYRSDWTNELGVLRPATVNSEVTVTNLNLYETLVLPAKVVLLTLGTNELNVATNSTWLLHSPTNDATQVTLSLSSGKFQGQLLFITSQNGDGGFILPDNSEQYDVPGALVDLQGNWTGTTNRGIILQYTAPDWIEMARFNPSSPAPEGFTTGAGVTNISNVLSGNYTAGSNITLATNANGAVSITAGTSSAANWTASGTTNSILDGTASVDGVVATNNVTVSGRVRVADGTAALPSIVFTSDDDASGTGFYRSSANAVGFTANGTLSVGMSTAGLFLGTFPYNISYGGDLIQSREAAAILQQGVDSATPIAQIIKGADGSGSNIGGGNYTFAGGRSTGTGVGGSIFFQTSPSGSSGSSQNALATALTIPSSGAITGRLPANYGGACSDETTALTTGTNKLRFRMPHSMTLTAVRANLTTAQTAGSILTVDINEDGTSLLSTKITIDDNETTSTTAATAPVISDTALADDAIITVDIDQVGTSPAGLKVWIIGYR